MKTKNDKCESVSSTAVKIEWTGGEKMKPQAKRSLQVGKNSAAGLRGPGQSQNPAGSGHWSAWLWPRWQEQTMLASSNIFLFCFCDMKKLFVPETPRWWVNKCEIKRPITCSNLLFWTSGSVAKINHYRVRRMQEVSSTSWKLIAGQRALFCLTLHES